MSTDYLVTEGQQYTIGVGKDPGPRFRAMCSFCKWRGQEQRHDSVAEDDMMRHAATLAHRERALDRVAAVATFGEDKVSSPFFRFEFEKPVEVVSYKGTAKLAPGDPGPIETEHEHRCEACC